MNPRGKRLRAITPARTLPADLMLEIVLRTDAATIVRSAACCKPLRRDILSPDFIRRFRAVPAACLLGFLNASDDKEHPALLFSLLHPATPAAASLSETRIAPLLSGGAAAGLLGSYVPVTSRRGLLVLRRRQAKRRGGRRDICVFDPFTGDSAFVPRPPGIKNDRGYMCVLLTAADGVGSSFLLLVADFVNRARSRFINIRTVSSAAAHRVRAWGRVTMAANPLPPDFFPFPCCAPVVLGSLIHWLMYGSDKDSLIFTYRVGATTAGTIDLPAGSLPDGCSPFNLHLTSSPDGRLRLLVSDQFTVSVWLLLSTGDDGWERQASIDISPLLPDLTQRWPPETERKIAFVGSAGGRSGVVLLWPYYAVDSRVLLLDMETKEMRWINRTKGIMSSFLYEVDLASRLSAMKSF